MTEAPAPLRIAIAGAAGRMGQALIRAVLDHPGCVLTGGLVRAAAPVLGRDLGELAGRPPQAIAASGDPLPLLASGCDALIDFTQPELSVQLAGLAAQARIVHVIGTTGFTAEDDAHIAAAGQHAAIVKSGNMSFGVAVLAAAARLVGALTDDAFDVEIVEMHHRNKRDAPSGTALLLGEAVAAGRGVTLPGVQDGPRHGIAPPRGTGTIGFASLRGGDVVGEHAIVFAGPAERIELTHRAHDRGIFASGAVRAALWARDRPPGVYAMTDVLNLGPR